MSASNQLTPTEYIQHVDRLADAGTAEQADLAALRKRGDQIDNLDAGLEQFNRRRQFIELRGELMDRAAFVGDNGPGVIDGAAEHIHDATEGASADRHRYRGAGTEHFHAAPQTVGRTHGDGANDAVTELLFDFERKTLFRQQVGGIVDEHQGKIAVETGAGVGTTFKVVLPLERATTE